MYKVITIDGKKYREVQKRPRKNPEQQFILGQTQPVHWYYRNNTGIEQQISPVPYHPHLVYANPGRGKRKVRRNPADAAVLVMVVALGVFVWYLHDSLGMKFPWETKEDKAADPAVPKTGAKDATGSKPGNSDSTANLFPSLTSGGIKYDDVVKAFTNIITQFEGMGYNRADWDALQLGEASPYDTIDSIARFKGGIIPSNPATGGADPQMFVKQYKNSLHIIDALFLAGGKQGPPVKQPTAAKNSRVHDLVLLDYL